MVSRSAESATDPPRTADPTWTPMIDFEHLSVDGAAALRTVHRMIYEPGNELIMAHLLVPTAHGLFEALRYPLAQAFDSVHLRCNVELGGTDQRFSASTSWSAVIS